MKVEVMQQATQKATTAGTAIFGTGMTVSGLTNSLNLVAAAIGIVVAVLLVIWYVHRIRREKLEIQKLEREQDE